MNNNQNIQQDMDDAMLLACERVEKKRKIQPRTLSKTDKQLLLDKFFDDKVLSYAFQPKSKG